MNVTFFLRMNFHLLWITFFLYQNIYQLAIGLPILPHDFNSFMTEAVIIYKPVHRFAKQINGLVSI